MIDAFVYLHPAGAVGHRRLKVHLAHYNAAVEGVAARALCGAVSELFKRGDVTNTGVHATCKSCRAQIPARVAYRNAKSREEYVERALAACVEQGFTVAIEDPATLNFLAEVLSRAGDDRA